MIMNLQRNTFSLCNTCYKEVPAVVSIRRDGVFLAKTCDAHGSTEAMLERDPVFYAYIMSMRAPNIYGGYFVDVTRICNLRCQYCFYPLENKNPSGAYTIQSIVNDCRAAALRPGCLPIILTGGEPTTRADIGLLIEALLPIGPVELLTNGVNLAKDDEMFNRVMPLITANNGVANLNLSIHHKETDGWRTLLDKCRAEGIKVESALIVVDSEDDFIHAVKLAQEMKDVVLSFRIKAATRIWNEKKPEKIFCSDMIGWLEAHLGPVQVVTTNRSNKSVFVNVFVGGLFLMLVSWNDTANVDLADIDCAPYYRAKNGQIANFVTASLINEGMAAGWLNGQPHFDGKLLKIEEDISDRVARTHRARVPITHETHPSHA